ncbi:threonine ammonia-lyase, biosynthetic [Candidatus Saccharibacteria bacterium]|nr:threonine ammonia-lyase, biosynthetic [Candidatus Saccharibacteria bacterium]
MNEAVKQILLARVYDVAIETPLQHAVKLSTGNRSVFLKREDLQPVHSFKLRGAYNRIAQLNDLEKQRGVIAASAGNHAQGVALSAQRLGISAHIVMPITTPKIKIEAVRSYGASVILKGDNYSEAADHCKQLIKSTGRVYIHPFDDKLVIAGQGTVGREILEQLPNVSHIFVPVGGGGLLAGISQYIKTLKPEVNIIGVEPDDSNAMYQSLKAGKRVQLAQVGIFADGVAVKQVGKIAFDVAEKYVDQVITVTTEQTCAAIQQVFEETRTILEPAGALATAGLTKYFDGDSGAQESYCVAICSGANISFERLQFVAERTKLGSGNESLFAVKLPEKPGALLNFCEQVINGYNISEFNYRLSNREEAHIFLGIIMPDSNDKQKFINSMKNDNYEFVDLSNDEVAKEHIRHMIGGTSSATKNEHLYLVEFPERPGALAEFLHTMKNKWNISLFHYRGQAGNIGRVLIGYEASDEKMLCKQLEKAGINFKKVESYSANIFL